MSRQDDKQIGVYMPRSALVEIALGMYVGDKCEFCHVPLTREDLNTARMGYHGPVHLDCWLKHLEDKEARDNK